MAISQKNGIAIATIAALNGVSLGGLASLNGQAVSSFTPTLIENFSGTPGASITSRAMDSGQSWTKSDAGSDIIIEADGLQGRPAPTNTTDKCFYTSTLPANVRLIANFIVNNHLKSTFYLGARIMAFDTLYLFGYDDGVFSLQKQVSGTLTTLGTYAAIAEGNYLVQLDFVGSTQVVTINGIAQISTADAEITSLGQYGIITWYTEAGGGYSNIDNFRAGAL